MLFEYRGGLICEWEKDVDVELMSHEERGATVSGSKRQSRSSVVNGRFRGVIVQSWRAWIEDRGAGTFESDLGRHGARRDIEFKDSSMISTPGVEFRNFVSTWNAEIEVADRKSTRTSNIDLQSEIRLTSPSVQPEGGGTYQA